MRTIINTSEGLFEIENMPEEMLLDLIVQAYAEEPQMTGEEYLKSIGINVKRSTPLPAGYENRAIRRKKRKQK